MLKPFFLRAGANEKLHLHLLKLAHADNELPGYHLVPESLAYLRNAKRYFHPARFLNVQIIHKYPLRCFGAKVNHISIISYCAHLGAEHQVKLAYVRPVACAAN